MFALQQLVAPSRRIALGLAALALTVTALVSPASPAQAANLDSTNVMLGQQSDLRATAVGKQKVGGNWEYTFKITNDGPATAPSVYVYQEAILVRFDGLDISFQDNKWVDMGSLAPGKTVSVKIFCKESNTWKCFQGDVVAKHVGQVTDPNPNNNTAAIKN